MSSMFVSLDFIAPVMATSKSIMNEAMAVINAFPGMDKFAGLTREALGAVDKSLHDTILFADTASKAPEATANLVEKTKSLTS